MFELEGYFLFQKILIFLPRFVSPQTENLCGNAVAFVVKKPFPSSSLSEDCIYSFLFFGICNPS